MASSENKNGYYQSIKKYDGSDPTYFPAFIAAVTDHYATWRNGEEVHLSRRQTDLWLKPLAGQELLKVLLITFHKRGA